MCRKLSRNFYNLIRLFSVWYCHKKWLRLFIADAHKHATLWQTRDQLIHLIHIKWSYSRKISSIYVSMNVSSFFRLWRKTFHCVQVFRLYFSNPPHTHTHTHTPFYSTIRFAELNYHYFLHLLMVDLSWSNKISAKIFSLTSFKINSGTIWVAGHESGFYKRYLILASQLFDFG